MSKPDGIPQDVWDAACECFAAFPATGLFRDYEAVEAETIIAHAIMVERSIGDELASVLKDLLAALRKEAPGTPLNNHKYDQLGIRAYDAIRKRGEA